MIKPSEGRKTLSKVIRMLKTASVFIICNHEQWTCGLAEAKTGQRWQRVTTFAASLTCLHATLKRMISQNMHRLPAESFILSRYWTFATESRSWTISLQLLFCGSESYILCDFCQNLSKQILWISVAEYKKSTRFYIDFWTDFWNG